MRIDDTHDILSEIWNDRPPIPSTPVFVHDIAYTGLSASQKLEKIREKMKEGQASVYILGSLDSIAWLYNIRGADVANNPFVIAYAAVSLNEAILFVDEVKLSEEVKKHLSDNGIQLATYDSIADYIASMDGNNRVFMDPKRLNSMLFNLIPKTCTIVESPDIANVLKAVKNSCEIENIRNSQSRDGAVMVKFLIWLEESIQQQALTELDIVDNLSRLRQEQPFNYGDSFDAIAAYKSNAAMMHYKATIENHAVIGPEGFLLVDSGGQYLDGTTDITRTIAMGPLTEEEVRDFTLTLKSHIGLATAKFLEGTPGCNLDVLARTPMWNEGMDYKCGTGHGLGYFLSVHEGPQGISQASSTVKLVPGMLITNEPGVYKAGKHGIRTENTILVITDEKTDDGQFYRFETVSSCPIDKRGINPVMLTDNEKKWLNNYHLFVYETLCPLLNEKERLWLEDKTSPI
jgi:Xaa-Pro aminopeptidase